MPTDRLRAYRGKSLHWAAAVVRNSGDRKQVHERARGFCGLSRDVRRYTSFLGLMVAVLFALALAPLHAHAATIDLVVNIVSDQPAYMSFDLEHFTVTISNNGPDPATNVLLTVNHPVADVPYEASATCQPVPGPNPNGPAVCPAGSAIAPSPAFTRVGQLLQVTIPAIPSQSQVMIQFDNRARCPPRTNQEERCFGQPEGNFPITATVSAAESDVLNPTNTATTNIFLYPPDIRYRVSITSAPATANPGTIAEYEFEVQSIGNQPSDQLRLSATIQGRAGTMQPLTATNNPHGANGSTLPSTVLQSIDCLSTVLGSYPPSAVFPPVPAPWQICPGIGVIPVPVPTSPSNISPIVTGFPSGYFLDNLPGTVDAPAAGGAMKFKAHVLVGNPVCVAAPDSGYRELVFRVNVTGLFGTDLASPGAADNTVSVITQVPGTCKEANIEFLTSGTPPSFPLVAGVGNWTHTVTVTNLSSGVTAGTATNVPVQFEHHQVAFTETQGPLICSSTPVGLCPAPNVNGGAVTGGVSSTAGFSYSTTLASLPPLAVVTFSQAVTETRTACWFSGTSALINLSGTANPSPALFDPNYSPTTPSKPPDFTLGSNPYYGNNGRQTVVTVTGLTQCPGGGPGNPPGVTVTKSGPFASAAAANAGSPLIGQSMPTFLPDATQVFYKVVVTNTNSTVPLLLGDVLDNNYFLSPVNTTPVSGFLHTGNALAGWGITCVASPGTETCHERATTPIISGYNNHFTLNYDPALHGGNTRVALAPLATLTYIIPFTTPTHTNKCQPTVLTSNTVSAAFVNAVGVAQTIGPSIVTQYIGMPPCVPGVLDIQKNILPPATTTSIPVNGLLSFELILSNTSTTATLDVAHLVDMVSAPGVTLSVVSVACTPVSGGAKCPPTPVIPGTKTPATGSPTPLPQPFDIDHEWGFPGNNTFPPGSSVRFTLTVQLSNPTRDFGCVQNRATFSGENDPKGWTPKDDFVFVCPPDAPELSLQKKVSPQIAAPNTLVTYTVIVTNIGPSAANNTVFSDPLPAGLLGSNPAGYSNVACTDLTAQAFVPNPKGVAVCPSFTSNASGLSATISTFGANTALQFTYQAVMPAGTVSINNLASVSAPSPSGLSFGVGTAQSQENVQVIAAASPEAIPTIHAWQLLLLGLILAALGGLRIGGKM